MTDWAETVLELYLHTQQQRLDLKQTIDFLLQKKPSDGELQSLIIHDPNRNLHEEVG